MFVHVVLGRWKLSTALVYCDNKATSLTGSTDKDHLRAKFTWQGHYYHPDANSAAITSVMQP